MANTRTTGAGLVVALAVVLGAADFPADGQAFEVVSIREVPRDAPPLMREVGYTSFLPGGQFIDPRITVSSMIIFAFSIPNFTQLTGLQGWTRDQEFSVAAKPPEGFPLLSPTENREQVRAMVRDMLSSRFQLKIHTETRPDRAYKLEVAHGGLKIKAVDPPVPPQTEGFPGLRAGDSGGRLIGNKTTMARIASALAPLLTRPVFDETGLKDYYTFDVNWTAPEPLERHEAPGIGVDGVNALVNALKDLLGLQLRSEIVPLTYWVVDRVERPTGN
jgi:uncharacterized protein (TIGR03435 family)